MLQLFTAHRFRSIANEYSPQRCRAYFIRQDCVHVCSLPKYKMVKIHCKHQVPCDNTIAILPLQQVLNMVDPAKLEHFCCFIVYAIIYRSSQGGNF